MDKSRKKVLTPQQETKPVQIIVARNRNKSFTIRTKKLPPTESAFIPNTADETNTTIKCTVNNTLSQENLTLSMSGFV
ncbi:unnamed protein product [Schistosoma mattheei]|uniref:Uncharacterized protein n=1 Tax=Schistosoma mattheei TaxID=31246 RepID=A0A183NMM4_9TREM|nr:unnamed protein product [Schistosoma mattheei]